jgi:hypothetical protein
MKEFAVSGELWRASLCLLPFSVSWRLDVEITLLIEVLVAEGYVWLKLFRGGVRVRLQRIQSLIIISAQNPEYCDVDIG